jgi:hypothetical protein
MCSSSHMLVRMHVRTLALHTKASLVAGNDRARWAVHAHTPVRTLCVRARLNYDDTDWAPPMSKRTYSLRLVALPS